MTGSPPMVLPRQSASLRLRLLEIARGQHFAQIDGLARLVRQFDADGVAAGHDGDAGGDGAHRAGDVVGEPDDAGRLDAGRRLEFVKRDDRAGPDMDDLALDAEILEHAFEQPGILLQRLLVTARMPLCTFFGSASRWSGGSSNSSACKQRGLRLARTRGARLEARRGGRLHPVARPASSHRQSGPVSSGSSSIRRNRRREVRRRSRLDVEVRRIVERPAWCRARSPARHVRRAADSQPASGRHPPRRDGAHMAQASSTHRGCRPARPDRRATRRAASAHARRVREPVILVVVFVILVRRRRHASPARRCRPQRRRSAG